MKEKINRKTHFAMIGMSPDTEKAAIDIIRFLAHSEELMPLLIVDDFPKIPEWIWDLMTEYNLIQDKKSKLNRAKRDGIEKKVKALVKRNIGVTFDETGKVKYGN